MEILDVQNVYDNILMVQKVTTDEVEIERIKRPAKVVGICHDPVNDVVMMLKSYNYGSMMEAKHFPATNAKQSQAPNETLKDAIELATGAQVKAVQHITSFMASPDFSYAPTQLFYVTFDSRSVMDNEDVVLTTGKELYRQVVDGEHSDIQVIFGAHYLKMMHNNLIK